MALDLRSGLVPAVPVPFTAGGAVNREAQQRYAKWMSGQPVRAVAIWAHTGRGLLLDEDQRLAALEDWREGAPAVPLVCGVGVPRGTRLPSSASTRTDAVVRHTARLAQVAKDHGAAAVMVHPPSALKGVRQLDERIMDLHRGVLDVGLPVIAFWLYEAAGGLPYSAGLLDRLLALGGIIGIKCATLDSVMTYQDLATVVQRHPRVTLITGEDRFLGYSLMMGAEAALIGMGAACTDVMASLLDAWRVRDLERFTVLSSRIDQFGQATFTVPMEGYIQRMLWALQAEGVIGDTRDPFGPRLPAGERERVAQAVAALRAS